MNELAPLEARIAERFGVRRRDDWSERVTAVMEAMAAQTSLSRDHLLQRLGLDDGLLRELVGQLTVQETYFFRQASHYGCLIELLERRVLDGAAPEPTRVWSAGCSTGDEAYSLAIAARERWPLPACQQLQIVGTDIRRSAIDHAKRGRYARWAFRGLSDARRLRNFESVGGGQFELRAELRDMVSFHNLSIQEHLHLLSACSVDAILFRNVGVYLTKDSLEELYGGFARVLKPDGALLIAATDPRPPSPLFKARRGDDTTIFGLSQSRPERRISSAPPRPRPRTGPSSRVPATPALPPVAPRAPSASNALPQTAEPLAPSALVRHALELADRGHSRPALAMLRGQVERTPASPAVHLCHGQIQLAAGRHEDAVKDFRRALYLEPTDPIARYWYALALQRCGRAEDALRHTLSVRRQLEPHAPESTLSDGSTTAGELLRAAAELEEMFR